MISEDAFEWLICQDPDCVGFKIMSELSCAHDHGITYFLHPSIVLFLSCQSFEHKVYWHLMQYFLVFIACCFLLH
jgi:hypothetical protein